MNNQLSHRVFLEESNFLGLHCPMLHRHPAHIRLPSPNQLWTILLKYLHQHQPVSLPILINHLNCGLRTTPWLQLCGETCALMVMGGVLAQWLGIKLKNKSKTLPRH